MKKIGIGYEDYKRFIDEDMYYVDKTMLIDDVIKKGGEVTLFTRPRRFGKSLALSMLRTFFELEYDRDGNPVDKKRYFEGKKIMGASDEILSMMGKHPVIKLSLKSAKQPNFREAALQLRDEIVSEFNRHIYVKDSDALTEEEAKQFNELSVTRKRDELRNEKDFGEEIGRYATALKTLSVCLKKHHDKNVIILIDEYDVPLENAYYEGFYKEMVGFIRSLFESALKTNDALEFGVVTGCLRISKESIFTGLNHLKINSVMDDTFSEGFGFTEQETECMLIDYGLEANIPEVKEWYNGYLFGDTQIYNPWSVISYVDSIVNDGRKLPRPFWANTSSNQIIRDMIWHADEAMKQELDVLIKGGTIEKQIHEDITYDEIYKDQNNLWNFMFFTGYLKKTAERYDKKTKSTYITMMIPNWETEYIYRQKIMSWFDQEIVQKSNRSALFETMKNGDADGFEREINKLLAPSISYMDSYENFYHGFMAGILTGSDEYAVKSNRESGDGRSNLLMKTGDVFEKAFVIELKTVKQNGKKPVTMEMMDTAADEAIQQIDDLCYTDALLEEGYGNIGRYGISFFKKRCLYGQSLLGTAYPQRRFS